MKLNKEFEIKIFVLSIIYGKSIVFEGHIGFLKMGQKKDFFFLHLFFHSII